MYHIYMQITCFIRVANSIFHSVSGAYIHIQKLIYTDDKMSGNTRLYYIYATLVI